MKPKVIRILILPIVLIFCMGNNGCESSQGQVAMGGAEQVKNVEGVPKNSHGNTVEQQNIMDRIKVTTDPTKVLWIHLVGLDGKIIKRMPVRNKVTSSGKRLEPKHAAGTSGFYPNAGIGSYETDEFMQPDGTYGDSDAYIFWFDPMGRYHQWGTAGGLGYLLTDYPIDLEDPIDKITGLYKAQREAAEWQRVQEEQLRQLEAAKVKAKVENPPAPTNAGNPASAGPAVLPHL